MVFLHISAAGHPISMKFGMYMQILISTIVAWRKIKILPIEDGSGRHLENRFSTRVYLSIVFVRLTRNVEGGRRITCSHTLDGQNIKIWKFKMGTAAILKIVLRVVWFRWHLCVQIRTVIWRMVTWQFYNTRLLNIHSGQSYAFQIAYANCLWPFLGFGSIIYPTGRFSDSKNGHLTKISILRIQNGGRPPSGIL